MNRNYSGASRPPLLRWAVLAYLGISAPLVAAFIHSEIVFSREIGFDQAELENLAEPGLWAFMAVEAAITFLVVCWLREPRWRRWLAWVACVGVWVLWALLCEGKARPQVVEPNRLEPTRVAACVYDCVRGRAARARRSAKAIA